MNFESGPGKPPTPEMGGQENESREAFLARMEAEAEAKSLIALEAANDSERKTIQELEGIRTKKDAVVEGLMDGTIKIPDESQKAAQEASDSFWDKLDEYMTKVRKGESLRAPSRNEHRHAIQVKLERHRGLIHSEAGEMLWGRYFDEQRKKRNIPDSVGVMNAILYEGRIPEEVVIPEPKPKQNTQS